MHIERMDVTVGGKRTRGYQVHNPDGSVHVTSEVLPEGGPEYEPKQWARALLNVAQETAKHVGICPDEGQSGPPAHISQPVATSGYMRPVGVTESAAVTQAAVDAAELRRQQAAQAGGLTVAQREEEIDVLRQRVRHGVLRRLNAMLAEDGRLSVPELKALNSLAVRAAGDME